MQALPTGIVTFLYTDIEGSTALWEAEHSRPEIPVRATGQHNQILRRAIESSGGKISNDRGDGFASAYADPIQALLAAVQAQRELASATWDGTPPLKVRMGIHVGRAEADGATYATSPVLNQAARIMDAGHGGQIVLSSAVKLLLHRLPPGVELRALGEHRLRHVAKPIELYQVVIPGLRADFPPLKTLSAIKNNLPLTHDRFFGRSAEITRIQQLLMGSRLVTLTGVGGIGKTRLARYVAEELADRFPDGVWLVRLEDISDGNLLIPAIASALGISPTPGQAIEDSVRNATACKVELIILDNCEHHVDACAKFVGSMLDSQPHAGLRFLATSREALNIYGEQEHSLDALTAPRSENLSLAELESFEGVQLFLDRARATVPEMEITLTNSADIAAIALYLDGIPLAIELAAGQVKLFGLAFVATKARGGVMTSGLVPRSRPARHQSLENCINWSYDLLTKPEQLLFRRLSTFVGGWTLGLATDACAGDGIQAGEVAHLLALLTSKSLVRASDLIEGDTRYRFLEPVRQIAKNRLRADGQAALDAARQKHREAYKCFVETASFDGDDRVRWLDRLELERGNWTDALNSYLADPNTPDAAVEMILALQPFWVSRSHLREHEAFVRAGSRIIDRLSDRKLMVQMLVCTAAFENDHRVVEEQANRILCLANENTYRREQALALICLGRVERARGNVQAARSRLEAALEMCRELADDTLASEVLESLGDLAEDQNDKQASRARQEEAVAAARRGGSKHTLAVRLHNLARHFHRTGDRVTAMTLAGESLRLRREIGDRWGVGWSLAQQATWLEDENHDAESRQSMLEALELFEEIGDTTDAAAALSHLCNLEYRLGNCAPSYGYCCRLARWRLALGEHRKILVAFKWLAELSVACGRPRDGAVFAGFIAAAQSAVFVDTKFLPLSYPETLRAAWEMGNRMSASEAVAFAFEHVQS